MDALLQDIRYAIRLCLRTPGLHRGRGSRAGARHRREHRDLHARQRRAARAAAVPRSGAPGRAVGDATRAGPAGRTSRAGEFPALAASAPRPSSGWRRSTTTRVNLTGAGEPEELIAQDVTPDFFPTLRRPPLLGRAFTPDEGADGRTRVASSATASGSGASAATRRSSDARFSSNGRPITVIGVMPADIRAASSSADRSPASRRTCGGRSRSATRTAEPRGRYMSAIARLKPGVHARPRRRRRLEHDRGAAREASCPQFDTGWRCARRADASTSSSGDMRPALLVLLGRGRLRAADRLRQRRQPAARARRRAAARDRDPRRARRGARAASSGSCSTESLVLVLARRRVRPARRAVEPRRAAGASARSISPHSATVHLELSGARLHRGASRSRPRSSAASRRRSKASRADVQEALKDGARQVGAASRHRRIRQAFVVAEIALAVVLLVGAGLMLRSFGTLQRRQSRASTRATC